MNSNAGNNMSPNTFRRLLVAHGRTTTPGVFDASLMYKSDDIINHLTDKKKNVEIKKESDEGNDAEVQFPKAGTNNYNYPVAGNVFDNTWLHKEAIMNPPLSKSKSEKFNTASSYSFYTRPFKVHGKDAWEFAMRGLGSVDTLLNRYGYVEPMWRGEVHPAPLEMHKDTTVIKK